MAEILNPQDAELEEVILGACLIGREAMPMVADRLRPEMFYFDKNALIYAAMQVMYREGRQIDIITVKNELVARGKLDAAGGPYELTRISGRVASAVHLEYHVLILREKYLRREMILGFHKLLALAADETTDIGDTLVDAHNLLDRLEGECGAIEQDADMVMLLYRPALAGIRTEPVSKYPSEHLGVVIVAKHRNGETGDVYFAHNPSMTKLGEYVPPTEWLMRNAK